MVWAASRQALRTRPRAALQIDRHLVGEQLQHLALERGIAQREAREVGAVDGVAGKLAREFRPGTVQR